MWSRSSSGHASAAPPGKRFRRPLQSRSSFSASVGSRSSRPALGLPPVRACQRVRAWPGKPMLAMAMQNSPFVTGLTPASSFRPATSFRQPRDAQPRLCASQARRPWMSPEPPWKSRESSSSWMSFVRSLPFVLRSVPSSLGTLRSVSRSSSAFWSSSIIASTSPRTPFTSTSRSNSVTGLLPGSGCQTSSALTMAFLCFGKSTRNLERFCQPWSSHGSTRPTMVPSSPRTMTHVFFSCLGGRLVMKLVRNFSAWADGLSFFVRLLSQ
mmetsp:Transcript_13048/g.34490  ORF Transcript_13048/g.34490 Transcript_13048/m.34490 type:complete len:268 (-) Transcript_13048:618-1421(-)